MKSQNPITQLHYAHSDRTRQLKDVRKRRSSEIAQDQIYFVGFRIESGREIRYLHALIMADDYDSFLNGVAAEINTILDQSTVTRARDISLVFVRNLMILDPELAAATASQNIARDIQVELTRRDDDQYLVYCMAGEEKVCLIKLKAGNALLAIGKARQAVMAKYQKELLLLEVCQLHPVTAECHALFAATAERIKPFLNSDVAGGAYVH